MRCSKEPPGRLTPHACSTSCARLLPERNEHSVGIEKRSVKIAKAADTLNSAIEILGKGTALVMASDDA